MKQQSLLAPEAASRAVAHEKRHKNTISNEISSIQTKLTVGEPDDQYEQEADNVADTVMSMPEAQVSRTGGEEEEKLQTKPLSSRITPLIQRQPEEEEPLQAKLIQRENQEKEEELQTKLIQRQTEEEEEPIQAKLIQKQPEEEGETVQTKLISRKEEKSTATDASWLDSQLQGTKGSGNPLPDDTRASMGNRFGSDFNRVKIHTDANAVQMNKELHAQAFTHGNDIYFNSGKYSPESSSGKHLLAHELTHTLQQNHNKTDTSLSTNTIQKNAEDTFTVPSGWSIAKIAKNLNVSVDDLKVANPDKLRTWGNVQGFDEGEVIVVPGKGEQPAVEPEKTPKQVIDKALKDCNAGIITMPVMARALLPYVATNGTEILAIFENLSSYKRDNLAYALAVNSTDSGLAAFSRKLLERMSSELGGYLNTTSWGENRKQQERINRILSPEERKEETSGDVQAEAAKDLAFLREAFNNNLTGSVGQGGQNKKVDVKFVARGLQAKGYDVPGVSLEDGICNEAVISVIKKFQEEVVGSVNPDGKIDPGGTSLKKLFDKQDNSYSSGLANMFGQSASTLNKSLEGNPLATWKRTEEFNTGTNLYDYIISNSDFIDRDTYAEYISQLAKAKGVEEGSDNDKALGMAAKAASDEAYFNELTKDVGFVLNLSNETAGSHQVNSILKDRLKRFHLFLSAAGMFKGDMTGSACRSPAVAHRICIPHVMMGNVRPEASKTSIRNNLIAVYNDENVAGGKKTTNGEVADSDDFVWAKSDHFEKDEEGKATAMKDAEWFAHMNTNDPTRDWNVFVAEGYEMGDVKRFPLGLNAIPGRSNHVTGDAIDINKDSFVNKNDAMIDLIALNFGLIRPVGGEQWHFECTNMQLSAKELTLINDNSRESIK